MRRRRFFFWPVIMILWLICAPTTSAQMEHSAFPRQGAYLRVPIDVSEAQFGASATAALAQNQSIADNPQLAVPARPFSLAAQGADPLAMASALDCLTAAIYYEAGNEAAVGQRAVAQVVLNRVRHPAFPNTVCGVVFEGSQRATGCQFTFTCDGSLARRPAPSGWLRAQRVAAAALAGVVEPTVGYATHYHASYVFPYWAPNLTKVVTIGSHIFYQWQGGWSKPSAFSDRYQASEVLPNRAKLALSGLVLTPSPTEQFSLPPVAAAAEMAPARALSAEYAPSAQRQTATSGLKQGAGAGSGLIVKQAQLIDRKAQLKVDAAPTLSQQN